MKDNTYIVIQSWMVTKLDLKGTELIVYATIYGFSQDGESRFKGSRQYLAKWCNGTTRSVQTALNSLVERGLIQKFENLVNNVKLCEYAVNFTPNEKISPPNEKISLNNIVDNIEEDTNIINDISTPSEDLSSKGYSKEELKNEFLGSVKKSKARRPINRRPTLFDKCVAEINEYTDRNDLRDKLIQFLKIRLEVKDKPFGIESWRGMLGKLEEIAKQYCVDYPIIVQQSIDKGWLSFYPINQKADKKETVFCDIDMPNTADIKVKSKGENFSGKVF